MIILTRVDHRLLHGQVAFSWTQAIGADCNLIVVLRISFFGTSSFAIKIQSNWLNHRE